MYNWKNVELFKHLNNDVLSEAFTEMIKTGKRNLIKENSILCNKEYEELEDLCNILISYYLGDYDKVTNLIKTSVFDLKQFETLNNIVKAVNKSKEDEDRSFYNVKGNDNWETTSDFDLDKAVNNEKTLSVTKEEKEEIEDEIYDILNDIIKHAPTNEMQWLKQLINNAKEGNTGDALDTIKDKVLFETLDRLVKGETLKLDEDIKAEVLEQLQSSYNSFSWKDINGMCSLKIF